MHVLQSLTRWLNRLMIFPIKNTEPPWTPKHVQLSDTEIPFESLGRPLHCQSSIVRTAPGTQMTDGSSTKGIHTTFSLVDRMQYARCVHYLSQFYGFLLGIKRNGNKTWKKYGWIRELKHWLKTGIVWQDNYGHLMSNQWKQLLIKRSRVASGIPSVVHRSRRSQSQKRDGLGIAHRMYCGTI